MRSRSILSKNCSKHGENREISGPHSFWAPVKSNMFDVWNWNCLTFFVSKIEVEGPCPPGLPSGYAPEVSSNYQENRCEMFKFIKIELHHKCFPRNFVKFPEQLLSKTSVKSYFWSSERRGSIFGGSSWLLLRNCQMSQVSLSSRCRVVIPHIDGSHNV